MKGKLYRIMMVLTAVVLLLGAACSTAVAQTEDRLANLIQQTDLKFKVLDPHSYLVPFETDARDRINVYVTYRSEKKEFALMYTTLLDYEDDHEFRPQVLSRALRINNDYAGVKLCLDPERGDLDGQMELYMPTLDAESLSLHINMIAAIADKFMPELSDLEEGGD